MKTGLRVTTLLCFSLVLPPLALGQATPAAVQPLHLSAFGAATGTYTGLDSGRNLSFTAGADLSFKPFYRFYPSAEVRGTIPIDDGAIDAEKNILGGVKIERPFRNRLHPYGDILFGRGKITYENGGYPNPSGTLIYLNSVSNVLSFGGGVDFDLNHYFAIKLDAQYQRYGTPVTPSGNLWSTPLTAGVVYRFDFNRHFHYDKDGQVKVKTPPAPPPARPQPVAPAPPDAQPAPETPPPAADTTQPAPTPAPNSDATTPPPPPPSNPHS